MTQGSLFGSPPGGSATANIDGGSRGNPGPAGYGVRIQRDDGSIVELKEALGVATNNVAEYRGLLAAEQKAVEAEKAALTRELASVEAAMKEASEARASLVAQTDPTLIAMFEQVARARKGVAICAATRDGLCSACHVRLRPQVFQEVRRNDAIIQCFSCNRILYYVPPPAQAEPAVTHTT